MNLNFINKEFERLQTLQECIDYQFEPKSKNIGGKRNIYYEDLKQDFVNEVNTFGFSPFILEGFEKQRKNPNVMKYMNKKFNHGLTNYVRKQNQQVKYKEEVRLQQEKKEKESLGTNNQPLSSSLVPLKKKETVKAAKKETFLRKALENLAHNKLNISTEEDHLFEEFRDDEISNDNIHNNKNEKTEDIQKMLAEANKKRIIEQLREKYFKAIREGSEADNLPKITIAEFEKPNALKVNFENLFIKKNKKGSQNEKKIVALSKNKEYLFSGITKQNFTKKDGLRNGNNDGGGGMNSGATKKPLKKLSAKFWFNGGRTLTQGNSNNLNTISNKNKKNVAYGKGQTISHSCSSNNNKERFMLFSRAKKYRDSNSPKKKTNTILTE